MATSHFIIESVIDQYLSYDVITEELHPDIEAALQSPHPDAASRFKNVSRAVRDAIKKGHDTGLQDSKPKKGSSRAVYFPKDLHPIHLDGQQTQMPSVLKIAFHGTLDRFNTSGNLLGEHQNIVESDQFTNHHFGMLQEREPGKYVTNEERGVLAPFLGGHEDGHFLHQGRVEPLQEAEFRHLTKSESHPKGISTKLFYDALMTHHQESQGKRHYSRFSPEEIEKAQEHPFVEKVYDYVTTVGAHPGDLEKRNLGVWQHPGTGKRYPVIADYGYAGDVPYHYNQARKNHYARLSRRY